MKVLDRYYVRLPVLLLAMFDAGSRLLIDPTGAVSASRGCCCSMHHRSAGNCCCQKSCSSSALAAEPDADAKPEPKECCAAKSRSCCAASDETPVREADEQDTPAPADGFFNCHCSDPQRPSMVVLRDQPRLPTACVVWAARDRCAGMLTAAADCWESRTDEPETPPPQ